MVRQQSTVDSTVSTRVRAWLVTDRQTASVTRNGVVFTDSRRLAALLTADFPHRAGAFGPWLLDRHGVDVRTVFTPLLQTSDRVHRLSTPETSLGDSYGIFGEPLAEPVPERPSPRRSETENGMSRRTKYLAIISGVLMTAGAVASRQLFGQPASLRAPYTVEQEWIVHQVVRGIIDVSRLSEHKPLSDSKDIQIRGEAPPGELLQTDARYRITSSVAALPSELRIIDHVWSAKAYVPIVRGLLKSTVDTGSDDDETLATTLTDPSIDHLLAASERISARLAENPRSASAHDRAALLIGALALKEGAGELSDVRPALNRMAVHLAVAEALQPSASRVSRSLATAIVLALVGWHGDALRLVDELDASSSRGLRAWGRALRLRITGDWRAIDAPETLTRLEQAEHLRAVLQRRGYGRFLDAYDRIATVDGSWEQQRVTLLVVGDVESGHRFAETNVQQQLEEARHLWTRFHHGDPRDEELFAALNDPEPPIGAAPGGRSIQAIDWGLWAGFLQRHLCISITRWMHHSVDTLGLKDRAQEAATAMNAPVRSLRLYPVTAVLMAHDASDYARALASAHALALTHPEVIPAHAWWLLHAKPKFTNVSDRFPRDDFFRPHVPTGTAFDVRFRALQTPCERPVPIEAARYWSRIAPYDTWAVWYTLWPDNQPKPTMSQARAVLAALLDYDVDAVRWVYDNVPGTSADLILLARTMCTIDENHCDRVFDQLVRDGQEAEAAAAYEHYIAKARSRVEVSKKVDWLVAYYEEHGLSPRATTLARDAADTYSFMGLATYARLLDRRGDHASAEQLLLAAQERYDNATYLAAHYLLESRRTHDTALESKAIALVPKVFPVGLEKVALSELSNPPTDGIVFDDYGRRAEHTGLRQTDVIVGVDGMRVRSDAQYWYVIRSSFDPRVRFIAWRDGAYRELTATVPQRLFGATFRSYEPSGGSGRRQ
jgi:hypothetical protein